ncbi:glycosyltransferase [Geminicoccus roseus]|uniref:glycosyltransferase n=1 Tax=Geminicoccus roseus TaxID=404900 RepID=UPI0012FC45DB|nr:glycosyltransferase [Geminicoccus roseus]
MRNPKVAMITGYYNRGHLIQRTLDSMAAQTYDNLEIIVFDDRSQDDTADILRSYARKAIRPVKTIIHNANIGFTHGIINAIGTTDAEFIAVQGSGDYSLPDRISLQMELIQSGPTIGLVGSSYVNVDETSKGRRIHSSHNSALGFADIMKRNPFTHGEVLFRRTVYDQAGGYNPLFKYSQDYDLWLRIAQISLLASRPEILYHRYIQRDGVTYSARKAIEQAQYTVLSRRLAVMPKEKRRDVDARLRELGVGALVPTNDPDLQAMIRTSIVRFLAWGDSAGASELSQYLSPHYTRIAYKYLSHLSNHRLLVGIRGRLVEYYTKSRQSTHM